MVKVTRPGEAAIAVARRAIKDYPFLRDVMVEFPWRSAFPVKHRVRVVAALAKAKDVYREFQAANTILELADAIDVMVHLGLVRESYMGRTRKIGRHLKTYNRINNRYSVPDWVSEDDCERKEV